jgi:hypothetical protein
MGVSVIVNWLGASPHSGFEDVIEALPGEDAAAYLHQLIGRIQYPLKGL